MQKFFVKDNQIREDIAEIIGTDVNHIVNVLRLKLNDNILICNVYKGNSYMAKIIDINREKVKCSIIENMEERVEAKINITIFQGLPKAEKMEFIIQKCTELRGERNNPCTNGKMCCKIR